jgi:hypothetical protein
MGGWRSLEAATGSDRRRGEGWEENWRSIWAGRGESWEGSDGEEGFNLAVGLEDKALGGGRERRGGLLL